MLALDGTGPASCLPIAVAHTCKSAGTWARQAAPRATPPPAVLRHLHRPAVRAAGGTTGARGPGYRGHPHAAPLRRPERALAQRLPRDRHDSAVGTGAGAARMGQAAAASRRGKDPVAGVARRLEAQGGSRAAGSRGAGTPFPCVRALPVLAGPPARAVARVATRPRSLLPAARCPASRTSAPRCAA